MPVSSSGHVSHCLSLIMLLSPRSVLDVGCGFGLWGFLCREYLDVMSERVQPSQWKIRIDALEVFEPYIQTHQRALYDAIFIADVRDAASSLDSYELIIAGDVIEHLDKSDGEEVLRQLYEKAGKALLVNIPLGPGWEHPEVHGNPGELHRSQWEVEDFLPYPHEFSEFRIPSGARYGVFCCRKDVPLGQRLDGLREAAALCDARGDAEGVLKHVRQIHALDPASEDTAMCLADAWLKQGNTEKAVGVLERCVNANPSFHYGLLAMARILAAGKRITEAAQYLDVLLRRQGVEEALLEQARGLLDSFQCVDSR